MSTPTPDVSCLTNALDQLSVDGKGESGTTFAALSALTLLNSHKAAALLANVARYCVTRDPWISSSGPIRRNYSSYFFRKQVPESLQLRDCHSANLQGPLRPGISNLQTQSIHPRVNNARVHLPTGRSSSQCRGLDSKACTIQTLRTPRSHHPPEICPH